MSALFRTGKIEILEFPTKKTILPSGGVRHESLGSKGSRYSRGSRVSARKSNETENGGLKKTLDLPISHLYSIYYPQRTTEFELVFNYPNDVEKDLEEPTRDFKQIFVRIKCPTADSAENWIKHVLLAVADQILLVENIADTLRKNEAPRAKFTMER